MLKMNVKYRNELLNMILNEDEILYSSKDEIELYFYLNSYEEENRRICYDVIDTEWRSMMIVKLINAGAFFHKSKYQIKHTLKESKELYAKGISLEKLETEYKDLPIDWVISLYS